MTRYHITTKKRTYNSVNSPTSFKKTRRTTKDKSTVTHANRWNSKTRTWVKAGKKQFKYRGK